MSSPWDAGCRGAALSGYGLQAVAPVPGTVPEERPGPLFGGAATGQEGRMEGHPSPAPGLSRRLTWPSCSHAVWYSARWHRSFTRWYLGRKFSWASTLSLSLLWSSLLWGRAGRRAGLSAPGERGLPAGRPPPSPGRVPPRNVRVRPGHVFCSLRGLNGDFYKEPPKLRNKLKNV